MGKFIVAILLGLVAAVYAEAEAEASPDAYYGYYGHGLHHGYGHHGYRHIGYGYHGYGHHGHYYGKREAEPEADADAEASPDAYYGYYGHHGLGYGYHGYGHLGYAHH